MTALEYVLVGAFAASGLLPLAMAVRWEQRLRHAAGARPPDEPAAPTTQRATRAGPG